ncbi:MAG: carboxyl transferase domain-containing protein [Catalinimonas sp.]
MSTPTTPRVDLQFNRNEDRNAQLVAELRRHLERAHLGGGQRRIDSHHEKGKLTARERIDYLRDENSDFVEIGALAGEGMYEEVGGCPGGGVVTGIGRVSGQLCVIVANDATVKAGAWFPITAKKNLRAQEIAIENRLPTIYLVDSAGVFLPMQDEVFPDKEHFGRQFRNNARMSALGIPQVAAVMGACVAGGAYLPIMSDEALIVEGTGSIFLAGPYLVKAAVGEDVDQETLGGADTHTAISGIADHKFPDDQSCLDHIRRIFEKLGPRPRVGFNRAAPQAPAHAPEELYGVLPADRSKPYDMRQIIARLVDGSDFDEYKPNYGQTVLCGTARVDGWAVGIVANQRQIVRAKRGTNTAPEMQMGGVIYSDSADKAARFVMLCNQKKLPLVFLQDVTGFMVGSRAEQGGIIKDGAKLVNAVANSIVPKFTVIVGNSFGAGNYAMCGKAYDPRLIVAWPSAQLAVMSGASAAKTMLQIQVATRKAKGEEVTPEAEQKLFDEIKARYEEQMSPYYAAARLWVDAVIDPVETRRLLSTGIAAADLAPLDEPFRPGVLQT